jgi:hypothetical protein
MRKLTLQLAAVSAALNAAMNLPRHCKLSEAIKRAIPMGVPQGFGSYYSWRLLNDQKTLCACAIGQAGLGLGLVTIAQAQAFASDHAHFAPWVRQLDELGTHRRGLRTNVIHANDARKRPLSGIVAELEFIGQ